MPSKQQFLGRDRYRLEVETTPTTPDGLINLNPNPSGDLGAWGWSATNGTVDLSGVSSTIGIRFKQSVTTTGGLQTYYLPITAGQWASARYDLLSLSASRNVKSQFIFYDASRSQVGSATTLSTAQSTAGTYYATAAQAPSNTAYVRLILTLYNGTGTASVGETFVVRNVMVTKNATNTFTTVRTNLITNPSFETNATGWTATAANGGAIDRVTTEHNSGSAALRLKQGTGPAFGSTLRTATTISVTAGKDYSVRADLKGASGTGNMWVYLVYYDAANGAGNSLGSFAANTTATGSWQTLSIAGVTAPVGAVSASVAVVMSNTVNYATSGAAFGYIDAVMVEQSSTVGAYFDGSTTLSGYTTAWTGTAHASTSTATTSSNAYNYVDPRAFQNILGQTFEIKFNRSPLDSSTLTAVSRDPALDPSETDDDVLRVGRQVRVMVLVDFASGQVWQPIYTGFIDNVRTTFPVDKSTGKVERRITLSASSVAKTLANTSAANGYDYVPALTQILGPTNVPYLVNGFAYPVTGTSPVAVNADASVADQIMLTRDTVRGLAWDDRFGRVQVWDTSIIPGGVSGSQRADVLAPAVLTNCTRATVSATTPDGTQNVDELTASAAGQVTLRRSGYYVPVTGGKKYQVSAFVKALSTGRTVSLQVGWVGLDYSTITTLAGSGTITDTTSGFTQVFAGGANAWVEAPPGAYGATIDISILGAAANEKHQVYKTLITEGIVNYDSLPSADTQHDSYTDIDVNFATDACVNNVTVNFTRYDAVSGESTLVPYNAQTDPSGAASYVDQNSVDENGAFSKPFTILGSVENTSVIRSYAAAVLAANANPGRTVNSMTVSVRDLDGIRHAVLNDLCSLVNVAFYDRDESEYIVNKTVRIGTIEHTLTPQSWDVTYTFDPVGSVASPTETPVPTNGSTPAVIANGTLYEATGTHTTSISNGVTTVMGTGWTGNIATPGGYFSAYSAGVWTVAVAGTYLINASATFASNTSGRRIVMIFQNGAELRRMDAGSGGLATPAASTFAVLAAGDTIDVRVFQSSGAALALTAAPVHRFQMVKIA